MNSHMFGNAIRNQYAKYVLRKETQALKPFFDEAYYLRKNPDVADADVNPIDHYCRSGWLEGRDPSADFSTNGYLAANPDVAEAQVNPLFHYVTLGKTENRPNAPFNDPSSETQALKSLFDEAYYLRKNPDVADADVNPIDHYCRSGWLEGRDPSADFSTNGYLAANPDVAEAQVNPLFHYVTLGKSENRPTVHPGGYKALALKTLPSAETFCKDLNLGVPAEDVSPPEEVLSALSRSSRNFQAKVIVCFSHSDYTKVTGGTEVCIRREQKLANTKQINYLNFSPIKRITRLAHESESENLAVACIFNGSNIGNFYLYDLIAAIAAIAEKKYQIFFVIHHLLGLNPELIKRIIASTGQKRAWFWTHDYFSICPSWILQRNDVAFCGAPNVNSNACRLCYYGIERGDHLLRLRDLFSDLDVNVIAPSTFAANFWQSHTDLGFQTLQVVPHMLLEWEPSKKISAEHDGGPICVGFIGMSAPDRGHKGWPLFARLMAEFAGEGAFRFFLFGDEPFASDNLKNVHVTVSPDDPSAMIRTLKDHKVDVLLCWRDSQETFSITTHEGITAGAFILTNKDSGNICEVVRRYKCGIVFESEYEILELFASGDIRKVISEWRNARQKYEIHHKTSNVTLDALSEEGL